MASPQRAPSSKWAAITAPYRHTSPSNSTSSCPGSLANNGCCLHESPPVVQLSQRRSRFPPTTSCSSSCSLPTETPPHLDHSHKHFSSGLLPSGPHCLDPVTNRQGPQGRSIALAPSVRSELCTHCTICIGANHYIPREQQP